MIKSIPSVLIWCCWMTSLVMFLRMPTMTRALGVASQRYQRRRGGVPSTQQVYGWSASSRAPYTTTTMAMGGTAEEATTTQYTIDCPPTDPETLKTVVTKHVNSLDRYLSKKPIAGHTRAAFDQLQQQNPNLLVQSKDSKLILDSGCGTGRSSLVLGELFPDSFVIGVDRSMARLQKNPKVPRNGSRYAPPPETSIDDNEDENEYDKDSENILVQQVADNVWLVRAELVDFWHIMLEYDCRVQQHYMLYPNPYPKSSRLKTRWYAHPSFPLLLHLSGERLTVRSNWQQYLEEFALAAEVVAGLECTGLPAGTENPARRFFESSTRGDNDGGDDVAVPNHLKPTVVQRSPSQASWTNFEEKYDKVGEATYDLTMLQL